MEVHRYISTSFEQPSIDIGLDLRSRGLAQAKKRLLDTVLRPVEVASDKSAAIGKQRSLKSVENRFKPFRIALNGISL
jgi:hypothetical protein